MAKFNAETFTKEFAHEFYLRMKHQAYGARIANLSSAARAVCARLNYTPLHANHHLVIDAMEKWWASLPGTKKWGEKATHVRSWRGRALGLGSASGPTPYSMFGRFIYATDYGVDEAEEEGK